MVPELLGKMCTSRLFSQGIDLFVLKFYLYKVIPINHSGHQRTRDTGLPDSKDHILLHSVVLTQYHSVTDRQTDGFSVANTVQIQYKASLGECCKNE